MNHGDVYPRLRRVWKLLVVLAQSAVPAKPCQRSFNYPPSGEYLKLMAVPGPSDDFQYPACTGLDPTGQLTCVSTVAPEQPEPRGTLEQSLQYQPGPVPVLNISRMHRDSQQHPHGVYNNMSFPSFHLLARVIAARPPFSVVLTDWLSMMAALGAGCLPWDCRTSTRRMSLSRFHVPSSLHCRKYHHTVPQGGKSWGIARHTHPLRRTYNMPLMTSRRSTLRLLPPGLAGGSRGASSFHWSSVRSLGYGLRFIPLV